MAYRKYYSGRNRYSSSGSSRTNYPRRSYRSSYSNNRSSSYKRSNNNILRTRVNSSGYAQYYDRRSGGWKYTHRRVAEKKMGGRIRPGYEVHHRNHNKLDDRPSNLRVLLRAIHRTIHRLKK